MSDGHPAPNIAGPDGKRKHRAPTAMTIAKRAAQLAAEHGPITADQRSAVVAVLADAQPAPEDKSQASRRRTTREESRAAIRAYVEANPMDWPPMTDEQRAATVAILTGRGATAGVPDERAARDPRDRRLGSPSGPPPTIRPRRPEPTLLYRSFDAEGRLLYVGITHNPDVRSATHSRTSTWAQFADTTTTEWHATWDLAHTAEREAIESERPLFNSRHQVDATAARARLVSYLVEKGRLDLLAPTVSRG